MDTSASAGPPSLARSFARLPAELRLQIWTCAAEPRVVILSDLVHNLASYPLPSVTQLSAEARFEVRTGYEPVAHGSHLHFAKDILVCDASLRDHWRGSPVDALRMRVRRLAFWDCFPDDQSIDAPESYAAYLAACSSPERQENVNLERLWFPNIDHLWVFKIGGVDRSWNLDANPEVPLFVHTRETARQFRYWVQDSIVETARLDLHDPATSVLLREGRCGCQNCRMLNQHRPLMVSKVIFMREPYLDHDRSTDWNGWKLVPPRPADPDESETSDTSPTADQVRWMLVERSLTFSLRRDSLEDGAESSAVVDEQTQNPQPDRGS